MYEARSIGSNYEATKDLDVKDIAKLVRSDIRRLVKNGEIPAFKYSTRIDRFSGGCAIRVSIESSKDLDVLPYRQAFYGYQTSRWHNEEVTENQKVARETYDKIKRILDSYNYDASEPMIDYFNVKFYGSVSYAY